MSKKQKKSKYGWDRRRVAIAAVAGGMALLLLVPIIAEIFTLAMS